MSSSRLTPKRRYRWWCGSTVSPRGTYPSAVREAGGGGAFLRGRAGDLGLDPHRIILAGDSAGAQLAAQLAVLATNPDYVRLTRLPPPLDPAVLRGVILHGGRNWSATPAGEQISVLEHLTAGVPPAFVPALPHEYQFHLNREEAQQTLTETLAFLQAVCPQKTPGATTFRAGIGGPAAPDRDPR